MYKDKIKNLVEQMTLDEKIGMIHGAGLFRNAGVERLGIPSLKMADGPMGVRAEFHNASWMSVGLTDDYVTYLPCGSALASTWNTELAYAFGNILGNETRGRGKDMILAPSMNIIRSPLCGRNFEYLSEDTYHTGEIAKNVVKGIQNNDVACCIKHFACNNQETERLDVDTKVSEKTLHDIYLKHFKTVIDEADALGVMGAYNLINGEKCCESKTLLNDILRDQWGYDGLVVSDWSGIVTTKGAAEAAIDLEMSVHYDFDNYFLANPLKEAVEKGEVAVELIDDKVSNILNVMFKLNMIENTEKRKSGAYNTLEHRVMAKKIAKESIVLLKNDANILPFKKSEVKKLLVIGDNAERIHSNGGGSAEIKALYEISPLMGLKSNLGGNVEVTFARGYTPKDEKHDSEISWQEATMEEQKRTDDSADADETQRLYEEAISLAKEHDHIIFVGGLNHKYDVEGLDRDEYELPYGQDKLINDLLEINPNMVVVMLSGSAVNLTSISEKAKTLVWSWYAGIEGGNALYKVLFGNVNPSGRLNQTFAKKIEDYSSHSIGTFGRKDFVEYLEEDKVGYRHFTTSDIAPLYPFGYGLSYTTFEYSHVNVLEKNGDVEVSLVIKNTGDVDGYDVPQIYAEINGTRNLVGFKKVFVNKGESKTVVITVPEKEFYKYSVENKKYMMLDKVTSIFVSTNAMNDVASVKL